MELQVINGIVICPRTDKIVSIVSNCVTASNTVRDDDSKIAVANLRPGTDHLDRNENPYLFPNCESLCDCPGRIIYTKRRHDASAKPGELMVVGLECNYDPRQEKRPQATA